MSSSAINSVSHCIETVRYLVGLPEVEVNHRNGYCAALHLAMQCYKNGTEMMQVLIDAGADIETKNGEECSALYNASEGGLLDVVKMLVQAGADVRTADEDGYTSLHVAVHFGQTETVRYLVGLPEVEVNHRDIHNETALHLAANHHPDVVQVLLDAGADIESKNNDGRSPLHSACASGKHDAAKMLVEAGADVRATDNEGSACLTLAAYFGDPETVGYLVGLKGVDVDHRDAERNSALILAVHKEHPGVAKVLIDAGADIESKGNKGRSALHRAGEAGVLAVVKMLVEAGANVRATDNEGYTSLHVAAYFGQTEIVRYLVGLPGVEVNHRDAHGETALHWAAQKEHTDVVQVLIDAGA